MPPITATVSQPPSITVGVSGTKIDVGVQSSSIDVDVGGGFGPHSHGLISNEGKIIGAIGNQFVVTSPNGQIAESQDVLNFVITGDNPPGFLEAGDTLGSALGSLEALIFNRAPLEHTHSAEEITSGLLPISRIPRGQTSQTVCVGNDLRLSNARFPTSHASTHAASGTDPVTPLAIGAESLYTYTSASLAGGSSTLAASRARVYTANVTAASTVSLPVTGNQVGDRVTVRGGTTVAASLTITGSSSGTDTISSPGQQFSYTLQPVGAGSQWVRDGVNSHTHSASDISGLSSAVAAVAPVRSVLGKTGDVSLSLGDIANVSLSQVSSGDLIKFSNGSWRNSPQDDITDGGNF